MKFLSKIFLPLLFSFLIWLSISLSQEFYVALPIEIKITQFPNNTIPINVSKRSIKANVRGQGWKLFSRLNFYNNYYLIIDDGKLGTKKINLRDFSQSNVWLSANFQIISFEPESITYEVDELVEKKMPVRLNCSFSIARNFIFVSKIYVNPDSISVILPKSIEGNINYIETKKYYYINISKNFDKMIELETIEYVFPKTYTINVKFNVDVKADMEFEKVKVDVIGEPLFKELSLYPPFIKVVLRSGVSILANLTSDSIKASVNFLEVVNDTTGRVFPKVVVPEFCELIDVKPKELRYVIKKTRI